MPTKEKNFKKTNHEKNYDIYEEQSNLTEGKFGKDGKKGHLEKGSLLGSMKNI